MSQMKLISRRQKQAAHVHRQKIGAVPASNRYSLEQTCARNTDLHLPQTHKAKNKKIMKNIYGKIDLGLIINNTKENPIRLDLIVEQSRR